MRSGGRGKMIPSAMRQRAGRHPTALGTLTAVANLSARFTLRGTQDGLILVIVEDYMKDLPREILHESLAALHAERLPVWVVERLANEFAMKAQTQLRKLAAREITNRKIARLFAVGRGNEEGFRGETVVSPPDEQALSNKVRQGL